MSFSMYLADIFSMIILIGIAHGLFFPFSHKWHQYIFYVYLFVIGLLSGFLLNYISTPLFLLVALCLIIFSHKNRTSCFWNMTLFLVSWLWFVISDYAVSIPLQLFGYSYTDIHASNWLPWIFLLITAITALLPSYFAGKWLHQKLSANPDFIPPKMLRSLFCEILVCTCIFLFNIIWGSRSDFPTELLLFNGVLFFGFALIHVFLYMNLYHTMQENQRLALKAQSQEELTDYTKRLEIHYQEMRRFRHDYINLLSTLSAYIHEGDLERLTAFFDSKIMPGGQILYNTDAVLGKLSNIHVLEVKGILFTKLVEAMNRDLKITLELAEEISRIDMDLLVLSKVIGIYLDNAIEAASQTKEKELLIAVFTKKGSIIFHIENSMLPLSVPLEQLFEQDYSTKEGHSGLGLYDARLLLSPLPNVQYTSEIRGGRFLQTLTIANM